MAYKYKKDALAYRKKWEKLNKKHRAKYASIWKKKNKDKIKRSVLKCKFNLSMHSYRQMIIEHSNVCKICLQPEKERHHKTKKIISLAIDHCHQTGKVRGLLCRKCNQILGKINDSTFWLDRASDYLKGVLL